VAADIHPAMKDPDHIYVGANDAIDDHVCAGGDPEIRRANLTAGPAKSGELGHAGDCVTQQADVALGLIHSPSRFGLVPDFIDIELGAR
jgi:hypothetical protein